VNKARESFQPRRKEGVNMPDAQAFECVEQARLKLMEAKHWLAAAEKAYHRPGRG